MVRFKEVGDLESDGTINRTEGKMHKEAEDHRIVQGALQKIDSCLKHWYDGVSCRTELPATSHILRLP
jgi:hypothetical protein